MNKYIITLFAALGVFGCSPESATPPQNDNVKVTHRVCAFDESDDDLLKSNVGIDKSLDWLYIHGLVVAPGDIDLDNISEDEALLAPFAVSAFLAPGFADIFSAFNIMYMCTEASYALDQCQWQLDNEGKEIQVSTVVDGNQNYTATVVANDGSGEQTQLIIDGVIGDLGNLTISFYDEGILSVTRESSRSSSGTETVRYTSESANWTATETKACSGSLEYESIDDDNVTTTVDATWSLSGSKTSGNLEFFTTNMDATYRMSW
ncbi:hypothetical protein [Reinekea sp.]|jgi:hypothetical protein|uniref:hypothetical protein n=1 Tax=Reinekea sp. TaxID=1970455 RepID=UPI00398A353C